MNKINNRELQVGDVFSESSHYIVTNTDREDSVEAIQFESSETIRISKSYLKAFTDSGDLFSEVIKVSKEDRKDGTLGIRSIFENIHNGQIFTVCFQKQDKKRTKKSIEEDINKAVGTLKDKINSCTVAELTSSLTESIKEFMANPIKDTVPGEDRILRGFKQQFSSRDGRYDCVDIDLSMKEEERIIRPVNINTIKWLIIDNIKFIV